MDRNLPRINNNFSFYRSDVYLRSHFKIVHEGKRFTCKICNRQFTRKNLLKQHMENVHEGETTKNSEESAINANSSIDLNMISDENLAVKNDIKVKPDPEILDFINDVEIKVKNEREETKNNVHEGGKTSKNSQEKISINSIQTSEAKIDPEILNFVNEVKNNVKNKYELKNFLMEYVKTVDEKSPTTSVDEKMKKSFEKSENDYEITKSEENFKKSVEEKLENENLMDTPKMESLPRMPIPPRSDEKPKLSYSGLIAMAIQNLPDQKASSQEIFEWIKKAFPYYNRSVP